MSWEEFLQDAGKTIINKWSDQQYTQDYELQRLRLQALGQTGYYNEGQPGVGQLTAPATLASMKTALLIGGGVLVLVLLLRKG